MSKYLNNKNYIMLYLDNFLSTFVNNIYAVFTPVILYKSGVSIPMIIFIYAIQFLVMGIFTPLSGILTKKYGIVLPKFISYVLKTLSLLLVLTVNINISYYILISITYGLSGAINNPLNTFIPGKIVEEGFRGRFNAFKYILRCFSSILGYIFVTIFLIQNNNLIIIIVVSISYLLSTIALLNIDKNKFKINFKQSFKESYCYLFKNKKNKKLKTVSGLRSFIIIERLIAVPVYLYISLNDLKTFTAIYVLSTLIELLSLAIMGVKLDKNSNKTFNIISFIKGFISFIFVIFKNKQILILNQSLYKLTDNVYDSAYCSLTQTKVEKDEADTLVLSMVHEMSLCFYEFIVLIILCMITIIGGISVFRIIFICSIIAVIINNILIKKWLND